MRDHAILVILLTMGVTTPSGAIVVLVTFQWYWRVIPVLGISDGLYGFVLFVSLDPHGQIEPPGLGPSR